MKRIEYKQGDRVGKCTYIRESEPLNAKRRAVLKCHCGNEYETSIASALRGNSCGCIRRANTGKMFESHGLSKTKTYKIWKGIKKRCTNPKEKHYDRYGGAGIGMAEYWINDPAAFCEYVEALLGYDVTRLSIRGLTLDRIDGAGNYEKGNLRWALPAIQVRNRGKQANNTSGFTGVYWIKNLGKYQVKVSKETVGYCHDPAKGAEMRREFIIKNKLKGYNV
jgi:hypothetical protein